MIRPSPLPETTRHIELAGVRLEYRLRRSARRTIGISVDQRGVRVGAPIHAPLAKIEALLRSHSDWLRQKLSDWQNRPVPEPLRDGSTIPWLGRPLLLRVTHDKPRSRWRIEEGVLELFVPAESTLTSALAAVLKPRARAFFLERLIHYAGRLGVPVPLLRLSSAKSRWGSCNARGEIRLSWRLIHFSPDLIDYVIAHELAHLKEMNHGSRFWAVVAQLYPDWQTARATLKQQARHLPEL